MADTLSIGRVTQIGVETTPGTPVAANRSLTDLMISVDPNFSVTEVRGAGHRFDAVVAPTGQEHMTGKVAGALGYNSVIYLFGMQFGTATPTTPGTATGLPGAVGAGAAVNARSWSWNVPLTGAVAPKTFTLEQGDATNAEQVPFVMLTDLGLDFTRSGVTPSGNALGQAINSTATGAFAGMSGSPTSIPIVPVLPVHWEVHMNASSSALGTSDKLLRCFHAGFSWGSVYGAFYPLNPSIYSYAGVADNPAMTQSALLELMKDSAGEALWTQARNGQPRYVRFLATSVVTNAGVASGYLADNYNVLTITGTPTGGSTTVAYKGANATINATNTVAQTTTALTPLLGAGNFTVTGGTLPGATQTVTLNAALANDPAPITKVSDAFTGGASPASSWAQTYIPYSIQVDWCGVVKQPGPQNDNSNLRTRQWDFTLVEDPLWSGGNGFRITVVNAMAGF